MRFVPRRSSYLIGIGVVVLLIGQIAYSAGQQQALVNSLTRYGGGGDSMAIGAVISIVGLSSLVTGLVNLARSVDYLAERESAREATAIAVQKKPIIQPSDTPEGGLSIEAQEAAARGRMIVDMER